MKLECVLSEAAGGPCGQPRHFTTEVLESDALMMRSIRASLRAGGEPLKFGIDSTPPLRDCVAELLQSCGLELIEQRTLGDETARLGWLCHCNREVCPPVREAGRVVGWR